MRLDVIIVIFSAATVAQAQAGDQQQTPWEHTQDTNGDGVDDWRVQIWRGPFGVTRQEVDSDFDGSADQVAVGTYDQRGILISWLVDDNADGWPEVACYFLSDSQGRRLGWELDADGDGLPESQILLAEPCSAPYDACTREPWPTC